MWRRIGRNVVLSKRHAKPGGPPVAAENPGYNACIRQQPRRLKYAKPAFMQSRRSRSGGRGNGCLEHEDFSSPCSSVMRCSGKNRRGTDRFPGADFPPEGPHPAGQQDYILPSYRRSPRCSGDRPARIACGSDAPPATPVAIALRTGAGGPWRRFSPLRPHPAVAPQIGKIRV